MRSYHLMIVAMLTCLGVSTPAHAQAPTPGQPYQIPAGFEGYGPGTLISYGGYNYVTQGDGTMLLQLTGYSGPAATEEGPAPGQPYQIPAYFAGLAAGSLVTYGGSTYVIQSDGTMLLQQSADPGADPSMRQPGYSYGSYYAQPGGAGYSGDPGGASYGSPTSSSVSESTASRDTHRNLQSIQPTPRAVRVTTQALRVTIRAARVTIRAARVTIPRLAPTIPPAAVPAVVDRLL
ncbi:MAG: hypothetical protein ACLQIB_53025, partial [Isosphaeraceae bacterium]